MRSTEFRRLLLVTLATLMLPQATRGFASDHPTAAIAAPRLHVKDLRGHTLDLAELTRHGPVVLDFWATWCAPCVEALPEFEALHRRYKDRGLTVIGISVDGPRNFSRVRPFTTGMGITYPIVLDADGGLQQRFHVLAVPTAFLIDTTGAIVLTKVAYRPGEAKAFEDSVRARLPAVVQP